MSATDLLDLPDHAELMIAEHREPHDGKFKPFAHPYYVLLRGFMHAHALHENISFPAGTFAPGAICMAYNFPKNLGTPKITTKYGIVSLGGNIPKSDVTKFCQQTGWPVPNLKVMAISGADTTTDPGGANVENNLDWQKCMEAWHFSYPTIPCDITLMIGPNTTNGIADTTTALVNLGCEVINISWGQALSQWSAAGITYTEAEFSAALAKGVVITPASGDNSLNDNTNSRTPDYPSASIYVWPVGGTSVTVNASGAYVSEEAWGDGVAGDEGGGGGFAVGTPIPIFQQGVVPGSYLGIPSSSANAAPKTGYQVYSDGAWGIVGGTSASAPLTASLFGVLISQGISMAGYQAKLYAARKTAFNDVHLGSNGDPAVIGWDNSTGNGSPNGPGFAAALGFGTVTPPPPIVPPPVTPPATGATIALSGPVVSGSTGTYKIS